MSVRLVLTKSQQGSKDSKELEQLREGRSWKMVVPAGSKPLTFGSMQRSGERTLPLLSLDPQVFSG